MCYVSSPPLLNFSWAFNIVFFGGDGLFLLSTTYEPPLFEEKSTCPDLLVPPETIEEASPTQSLLSCCNAMHGEPALLPNTHMCIATN